jgi:hypothetical protein
MLADGVVPDPLAGLIESASCDVALLAGRGTSLTGSDVAVLFAGSEHDWSAAELGAWFAAGSERPLRLVGVRRGPGHEPGDASRLLASASIAIQRLVGVDVEPSLADPGAAGMVAAAPPTGTAIIGFSTRWRHAGLGESRLALATAAGQTLIVHRGPRPGGLAPKAHLTRFTWTLAAD